jgi:hypothetical protein
MPARAAELLLLISLNESGQRAAQHRNLAQMIATTHGGRRP